MKMSKRETALKVIRFEFAEHGDATLRSTRAYIENRISREAHDKAARSGIRIFNQKKG